MVNVIPIINSFLVTSIGLATTHFDEITSRVTVTTHVANIYGVAEVFVIQWCLKHKCYRILAMKYVIKLICFVFSMKIVSSYYYSLFLKYKHLTTFFNPFYGSRYQFTLKTAVIDCPVV
jgi:hypothetical protein